MPIPTVYEMFATARAAAATKYAGAGLDTLCAAWLANERRLSKQRPGESHPDDLAVRDALKAEADRFGLRNALTEHIERWKPELLAV